MANKRRGADLRIYINDPVNGWLPVPCSRNDTMARFNEQVDTSNKSDGAWRSQTAGGLRGVDLVSNGLSNDDPVFDYLVLAAMGDIAVEAQVVSNGDTDNPILTGFFQVQQSERAGDYNSAETCGFTFVNASAVSDGATKATGFIDPNTGNPNPVLSQYDPSLLIVYQFQEDPLPNPGPPYSGEVWPNLANPTESDQVAEQSTYTRYVQQFNSNPWGKSGVLARTDSATSGGTSVRTVNPIPSLAGKKFAAIAGWMKGPPGSFYREDTVSSPNNDYRFAFGFTIRTPHAGRSAWYSFGGDLVAANVLEAASPIMLRSRQQLTPDSAQGWGQIGSAPSMEGWNSYMVVAVDDDPRNCRIYQNGVLISRTIDGTIPGDGLWREISSFAAGGGNGWLTETAQVCLWSDEFGGITDPDAFALAYHNAGLGNEYVAEET